MSRRCCARKGARGSGEATTTGTQGAAAGPAAGEAAGRAAGPAAGRAAGPAAGRAAGPAEGRAAGPAEGRAAGPAACRAAGQAACRAAGEAVGRAAEAGVRPASPVGGPRNGLSPGVWPLADSGPRRPARGAAGPVVTGQGSTTRGVRAVPLTAAAADLGARCCWPCWPCGLPGTKTRTRGAGRPSMRVGWMEGPRAQRCGPSGHRAKRRCPTAAAAPVSAL
jgi:hypothetical protein